MVVFKDPRKIKTITLPSFPDSEIIMFDSFLTEEWNIITKAENDIERGLLSLKCLIKTWNFTDDTGKVLEISTENLNKFPMKDMETLLNSVIESIQTEEIKKKNV